MTTDDGLAALLAEHQIDAYDEERNIYLCDCGANLDVRGDSLAAHQAAVVRAVGWRKGREEARVQLGEPYIDEDGNEHDGYMYVNGKTGRNHKERKPDAHVEFRTVTDWEEA